MSRTATSCPSPRLCCHASGKPSDAWLAVTAPGSVPGSTPVAVQSLRWAIGSTGPALPAGAVACGSTCGGATAPAGAPLTASSARAVATTPTRVGAERAIIAQNPLSAQVNSPTK